MERFEWNDSYITNIEIIDKQHKTLFDLANKLAEAIKNHHEQEILKDAIIEVINYTQLHFTTEEDILKKTNYPNYADHKKQHSMLIDKMRDLLKHYSPHDKELGLKVFEIVKFWIIHHIRKNDQHYSKTISVK